MKATFVDAKLCRADVFGKEGVLYDCNVLDWK